MPIATQSSYKTMIFRFVALNSSIICFVFFFFLILHSGYKKILIKIDSLVRRNLLQGPLCAWSEYHLQHIGSRYFIIDTIARDLLLTPHLPRYALRIDDFVTSYVICLATCVSSRMLTFILNQSTTLGFSINLLRVRYHPVFPQQNSKLACQPYVSDLFAL